VNAARPLSLRVRRHDDWRQNPARATVKVRRHVAIKVVNHFGDEVLMGAATQQL